MDQESKPPGPREDPADARDGAPTERSDGQAASAAAKPDGTPDKAEPEKARTEIAAGDVGDDLADFA